MSPERKIYDEFAAYPAPGDFRRSREFAADTGFRELAGSPVGTFPYGFATAGLVTTVGVILILLMSLLMLTVGLTMGLVITKRSGPVEQDEITRDSHLHPYDEMTKQETRYHQAMHYLAGACWNKGAADNAINALNTLLARTPTRGAPTHARPAIGIGTDSLRPFVNHNSDSSQG